MQTSTIGKGKAAECLAGLITRPTGQKKIMRFLHQYTALIKDLRKVENKEYFYQLLIQDIKTKQLAVPPKSLSFAKNILLARARGSVLICFLVVTFIFGLAGAVYAKHFIVSRNLFSQGLVHHFFGTFSDRNIVNPSVGLRQLIETELAKCDLVCANCHRIRTRDRKTGKGVKNADLS